MRVLIHPVDAEALDGGQFESVGSWGVRSCPHQFLDVADWSCLVGRGVISGKVRLGVGASDNGSLCTSCPHSNWNCWARNSGLDQKSGELEAVVASQRHENRLSLLVGYKIWCHDKRDWEWRRLAWRWRITVFRKHRYTKSRENIENLEWRQFSTTFKSLAMVNLHLPEARHPALAHLTPQPAKKQKRALLIASYRELLLSLGWMNWWSFRYSGGSFILISYHKLCLSRMTTLFLGFCDKKHWSANQLPVQLTPSNDLSNQKKLKCLVIRWSTVSSARKYRKV